LDFKVLKIENLRNLNCPRPACQSEPPLNWMPAAFDVLHRRAPHHRSATSSTEPPRCHLLHHPVGVLLLTDNSFGASDLPSGLPPLSTSATCTPPWIANPGEPPSFPTPQISPSHRPSPPSPLLASPRRRHHLDGRAIASWRGHAPWPGMLPCFMLDFRPSAMSAHLVWLG
jgi:hypothetical protein